MFSPGDEVVVLPPFGDSVTPKVVSEVLDLETVNVWDGNAQSAYNVVYLQATGNTGLSFPSIPSVAEEWYITQAAFRARFLSAEKVKLEIAAVDTTQSPEEVRELAANIRANEKDVASCQYINLKDPRTVSGVTAYESLGFLETGRAAVILNVKPTEDERYYP